MRLLFPFYLVLEVLFLKYDFLLSLDACHFDLTLFVTQNLSGLGKILEALFSIELTPVYELKLGHTEAIVASTLIVIRGLCGECLC